MKRSLFSSLRLLSLGIVFTMMAACSYQKTTFDIGSLFDPTWDFSKSSELSFDENYVEIKNGQVQLKPLDLEHSGDDFNNGNHVGTSFSNSKLALTESSSVQLSELTTPFYSDILGYWQLNGDAIATVGDNGTLVTSGAGLDRVQGKISDALYFDGVDDHISISAIDSTQYTVMAWINIDSFSNNFPRVLGMNSIELYVENNQSLKFKSIRTAGGQGIWHSPLNSVELNKWVHVAVTYDESSTSNDPIIYINGATQPLTEQIVPTNTPLDNSATLGYIGDRPSLDREFHGKIDEVVYWGRILSATQIQEIFNAQSKLFPQETSLSSSWTPKYDNIVGYWKMDGNWQDYSGNSLHGQGNGGISHSSSEKKVGNQSAELNGIDSYFETADNSVYDLEKITITNWFKKNGVVSSGHVFGTIVSKGNESGLGSEVTFQTFLMESTGQLRVRASGEECNSNSMLENDLWYHVVTSTEYKTSETIIKIYINGILDKECNLPSTTVFEGIGPLTIGNWDTGINNYGLFPGFIDDVAIFSSILNPAEVASIYNRQKQKYAGHYDSEVIDLGNTTSTWPDLSWSTSLPFGKELVGDFDTDGSPDSESSFDYSGLSGTLSEGLIGYWSLNESSLDSGPGGSDFIDQSNQENHGFDNGNTSLGSVGVLNKSSDFDGDTSVIQIPSTIVNSNLESQSYSAWILPRTAGEVGLGRIFARGNFNSAFRIYVQNPGNISVERNYSGANRLRFSDSALLKFGQWNHLVVTMDSSDLASGIKIFFNGKESSSYGASADGTGTPNDDSAQDLYFGNTGDLLRGFDGFIDEVGMWSRELTPDEIQQLYRRGANRVKLQVKSCVDSNCECKSLSTSPIGSATDCDGDTIVNALDFDDIHKAEFIGPGGDGTTYYSELFNRKATDLDFNCGLNSSDSDSNVCVNDEITLSAGPKPTGPIIDYTNYPLSAKPRDNQYFQYRVYMEADENTACDGSPCLPELTSVNLNPSGSPKYYGSLQEVKPTKPLSYTRIQSIKINADDCASFQVSPNGTDYYYVSGSSWVIATDISHRSSRLELQDNIVRFSEQFGPGFLHLKAFLETNSNQTTSCGIQEIDVVSSK